MSTLSDVTSAITGEWYRFVPPMIAIYFVIISPVLKPALEQLVRDQRDRVVLVAVASDWASRINFINTILASLITSLLVFAKTQVYKTELTFALFFILFLLFCWVLWWIIGIPAGQLWIRRTRPTLMTFGLMIRYGTLIRTILVIVNVILISATLISQLVEPHVGSVSCSGQS